MCRLGVFIRISHASWEQFSSEVSLFLQWDASPLSMYGDTTCGHLLRASVWPAILLLSLLPSRCLSSFPRSLWRLVLIICLTELIITEGKDINVNVCGDISRGDWLRIGDPHWMWEILSPGWGTWTGLKEKKWKSEQNSSLLFLSVDLIAAYQSCTMSFLAQ